MGGTPGLNLTEFLAFTHPSEVDYMAVRHFHKLFTFVST